MRLFGCNYRSLARGALVTKGTLPADVRQREIQRVHYDLHMAGAMGARAIDLVIDVGANEGQFARSLRDQGYKGKIVSFEPIPEHAERLKVESQGDPNWAVFAMALGSEDGMLTLNTVAGSTLSSGLEFSTFGQELFPQGEARFEPLQVPLLRLDRVISDHPEAFRGSNWFLKSDTQGFDLEVLKGIDLAAHHVAMVQCELSVLSIYENAPSYVEILAYLKEQGFVPLGFWPLFYHGEDLRIVEMDCVMARQP